MRNVIMTMLALLLSVVGFKFDSDKCVAFGLLLLYLCSIDDRLAAILNELRNKGKQ